MKSRLLYLLLVFAALGFDNKNNIVKWVLVNGCSLKVDGSTNVNNFSCSIANYNKADTIVVYRNTTQPVQLNGTVGLEVQNFDCHNPIMTADLRKTLKVKEFPKVTIRLLSICRYPDASVLQEVTTGVVVIMLAGVSKQFDVDYKVVSAGKTFINLIGTRKVNFSDFDITPPRKLGGMIRTENALSIEFNLKMNVIE